MEEFIKVHGDCILGVLHGFDRVVLRGTLRSVSYKDGLGRYMNSQGVLLKDFDAWAQRCTRRISGHVEAAVKAAGRPLAYLASSSVSKEECALGIARRDGIVSGLVCALSCVEPCMSPEIHKNAGRKMLELAFVPRKCKFYYLYVIDPVFGWLSIRLQSWIPFDVQVCINGRSYLQRRLDKAGIGYVKADNCFPSIDDVDKAQGFMDELADMDWAYAMRRLIAPYWPKAEEGVLPEGVERYYWSIRQSEVATDVMFRDAGALGAIYPRLCRHGIEGLTCEDVMRFFDKESSRGRGQVTGTSQRLVQGVRLKHQMGSNWIKMYDKAGSILRIETTVNDPRKLRVFRGTLEAPEKDRKWRCMAKAVADVQRRVALCRGANERYLDAMASVGRVVATAAALDPLGAAVVREGKKTRGLRPVSPDDGELLRAVMDGKHLIDGMTNGGLQKILYESPAKDEAEARRRSGRVGRQIRMLRRHGLIHKVGARRLYRVSSKGQQLMGLALAVRHSTTMMALAA